MPNVHNWFRFSPILTLTLVFFSGTNPILGQETLPATETPELTEHTTHTQRLSVEDLLARCEQALAEKDGETAVSIAESAAESFPESSLIFSTLGNAYALRIDDVGLLGKMRIAKKMLAAYQHAYDLDPTNKEAVIGLFEYLNQAPAIAGGDKDKANALLPALWETAPFHAANALARQALSQKDWSSARQYLKQALTLEPGDRGVQYQLGKLAALSGEETEEGAAILLNYLQLPVEKEQGVPSHDGALWRLGQIYATQNKIAEARTCFEKALAMDTNIRAQIQQDLDALDVQK